MKIKFVFTHNQFETTESVKSLDILSDIYKNIVNKNPTLKGIRIKCFLCNGESLDPDENFLSLGVKDESTILIYTEIKQQNQSDIEANINNLNNEVNNSNNIENIPIEINTNIGLNIIGFCFNKNCESYKKQVSCYFGFGKFNLIDDMHTKNRPICPHCFFAIIPAKFELVDCSYKLIGIKLTDNNLNKVEVNHSIFGKENIDIKNGFWVSMIITIYANN